METIKYSNQELPPTRTETLSDNINLLPTNKIAPTDVDSEISNKLFGEEKTLVQKIVSEGKGIILLALLFIVVSLPQLDDIIKKFIPITSTSSYILIGLKAIIFSVLYWIINNFYLARN